MNNMHTEKKTDKEENKKTNSPSMEETAKKDEVINVEVKEVTSTKTNEITESVLKTENNNKKAISAKKAFLSGLLAAGLVLGVGGSFAFTYMRPMSEFSKKIANILPVPVGYVDGTWISLHDFQKELDVVVKSGEADSDDTRKGVMDALIFKIVVENYAKAHDIVLDQAQMDEYFQQIVSNVGGEEQLKTELLATFGVNIDEFKQRVVGSVVLAHQVEEYLLSQDDVQVDRKQMAQDYRDKLINGTSIEDLKADTSDLVRVYGQNDGEPIKMSSIPEAAQKVIAEMSVGNISEVVDLSDTFIVIRLVDRSEDEDPEVKTDLIQVLKNGLDTLRENALTNSRIWSYFGQGNEGLDS